MTEPLRFLQDAKFATVRCDVCGSVRVLWSSLEQVELRRLMPRALHGHGWLSVSDRWHCAECASKLRESLIYLPSGESARAIKSALSESLFHGRILTEGMR